MTMNSLRPEIRWAVEAAQEKQAVDITVLKLSGTGAFAEYFLICSGQSQPQLRAIGDAIEERLSREGIRLAHREGKSSAEWDLLDYRLHRRAHFQRTGAAILRSRAAVAARRAH